MHLNNTSYGARHFAAWLMAFSRERRAHLARKWHYIEGLSITEISERLEDRGIASLARSTISGYLNEAPAEETIEKVRERQATEDIAIAESQQRKHDRAREDERRATEDDPIEAVRPTSTLHTGDDPITVPDWRVLEDDDRPDHAGLEDVFIAATGDTRTIDPGQSYYLLDPEGNPEYKTVLVGVARDQPDLAERRSFRYEQKNHNELRAQVLGIDEDQVNVDVGGSIDIDHSVPEEIVTAVVGASHNRLDNNADGGGVAGGEQTAEADNEP